MTIILNHLFSPTDYLQIRALRDSYLVQLRREGKCRYYATLHLVSQHEELQQGLRYYHNDFSSYLKLLLPPIPQDYFYK